MNNSIKTAQSQAGLDFAHNGDSRPTALNPAKKFTLTLLALLTITTGAWAQEETLLAEITPANYAEYSDIVTITQSGSVTTSVDGIYSGAWGTTYGDGHSGSLTVKVSDNVNFSRCYVRCNGDGETTVTDREFTLNFTCEGSSIEVYYAGDWLGYYAVSSIQIYGTLAATGPEVTTDTDGKTATMEMPASDVTVSYELVRDLLVSSPTFGGLPTGDNAIVKKGDDGKFTFKAGAPVFTLNDPLISGDDKNIIGNTEGLTVTVLKGTESEYDGVTAIELDPENPIALADFLANPEPGTYAIRVEAKADGAYDGSVLSTMFTLTEQYDLALQPADDMSKRGIQPDVAVGTKTVTLDADGKSPEGTTAQPAEKVTIKAKAGYVIQDVKVEKKSTLKTLTLFGATIYYAEGETWAEAIQNHATENQGWPIIDRYVNHDNFGFLVFSDSYDFVPGSAPIDPNASYDNSSF